ncbi:MAG: methyltransferase domain-containing protein, partial [Candidatus Micrarchaeota archaeon]
MAGVERVQEFYESFPYPQLPVVSRENLTEKMHANVMKNILESAGLEASELAGKKTLDAGCGTGEKACYFALHGADSYAFDRCQNSLSIARRNAEKLGLKVDFTSKDVLNFSY